MCWVPCSSHGLLKINRNRQKTWQRREKKQTTWKDNKYQQIKKEMERSTMSKRKTNVTIWWGICWGWCPQKLNSLGSMLAFRCGFDGHTQGTQQVGGGEPGQGGAYRETKCGHQSSPKTSKWHIFSFTKCKGKLGSLNCFLLFFCCSFSPDECPFRFQVSFRVPWAHRMQKKQSRFNPSNDKMKKQLENAGENMHQMQLDLRKSRAEWPNMLQNMFPHTTPGESDFFSIFTFVGARPSANKMKT